MAESMRWRPAAGLREIAIGETAVRDGLRDQIAALAVERPLVVCGANVATSPGLATVCELAPEAAIYSGSRPHTPVDCVDAGVAAANRVKADGIVALGGSSAMDCAKGIATLMQLGKRSVREIEPADFGRLGELGGGGFAAPMPVICLPTTLSMAEFQVFWGARDEALNRKLPYGDAGLVERTLILDGELAATTPSHLWLETGVKCLDDAIMRYCSAPGGDGDATDNTLEHAIRLLVRDLPASAAPDRAARTKVFYAAWLTAHPMPRWHPLARRPWFSTTARHALGGATGLAHGVGSCVSLVAALRFHEAISEPRYRRLAAVLGGAPLVDIVADLLERLGVPADLSAVGVPRTAMDQVIANMRFEAPSLGDEGDVTAAVQGLW